MSRPITKSRLQVAAEIGQKIEIKKWVFIVEYMKDLKPTRAAVEAGYAADHGYQLILHEEIVAAIDLLLVERLEGHNLDYDWLLYEFYDNHRLARAYGNINASNTALTALAKMSSIDAFAAIKVDVTEDSVVDRLNRGRMRAAGMLDDPQVVSTIAISDIIDIADDDDDEEMNFL